MDWASAPVLWLALMFPPGVPPPHPPYALNATISLISIPQEILARAHCFGSLWGGWLGSPPATAPGPLRVDALIEEERRRLRRIATGPSPPPPPPPPPPVCPQWRLIHGGEGAGSPRLTASFCNQSNRWAPSRGQNSGAGCSSCAVGLCKTRF